MSNREVSPETVIDNLAFIRFGSISEESRRRLKRTLKRFRQTARTRISETAIENWFREPGPDHQRSHPIRGSSLAFLHEFLTRQIERQRLAAEEQRELYGMVEQFLRPAQLSSAPRSPENVRTSDILLSIIVDTILDKGRRAERQEIDDFFYCSPVDGAQTESDHSFYVLYRYSTTGGIVKMFFVCRRPQRNFTSFYSFRCFLRGGSEFQPDVVRESQGVILKFETCYQFVGFTYRVPGDHVTGAHHGAEGQIRGLLRPRLIEILAAEYGDIDLERGLFPAEMLTMGASNQPLITRVALLHLGTVHSLGRNISHEDVGPTEMRIEHLGDDLRMLVSRLNELGCEKFPSKLGREVARHDWSTEGSDRLTKEIIAMLDNTPAWETSIGNPNLPKELHGRGAIETFSRSGTRPRP